MQVPQGLTATSTDSRYAARGIHWIASYPRSGNTWMRSFIYALGEVMAGRPATVDINKIAVYSKEEISYAYWKGVLPNVADSNDLVGSAAPTPQYLSEIYTARPRVQAELASKYRGNIFVKTHLAFLFVRGIPTINPRVTRGAVYLVRNPLDVACSFAPHMGRSIDKTIDRMAAREFSFGGQGAAVHQLVGSWSLNVESWTREDRKGTLVLRYEDLVSDPIRSFTSFVRHAGLQATDAQIEEAVGATEFGKLRAQEQERGFLVRPGTSVDRFFRSGKAGDWRSVLSRRQAKRIVSEHRDQMRRFGYLDEL